MRILVEDNVSALWRHLADVLADQHYTVDIALDGEAGWQQAEAFKLRSCWI